VSRYKYDRSHEFIPGYKFGGGHWRSVAIQTISEPEISHGTELLLRADERVRVQQQLQICLGCRSKSKKCDKQLTHIVRVMRRFYFIIFSFRLSRTSLGFKIGRGKSLIFLPIVFLIIIPRVVPITTLKRERRNSSLIFILSFSKLTT